MRVNREVPIMFIFFSEEGRSVRCIESVSELARRNIANKKLFYGSWLHYFEWKNVLYVPLFKILYFPSLLFCSSMLFQEVEQPNFDRNLQTFLIENLQSNCLVCNVSAWWQVSRERPSQRKHQGLCVKVRRHWDNPW